MSVTLTTEAHSFMLKEINDLGREVRELKKQNKSLTIQKQEAEQRSFCYEADISELKEKIKKELHEPEENPNLVSLCPIQRSFDEIRRATSTLKEELNRKDKFIQDLQARIKYKEEMSDYMEKVSDAKSDIILNMFSFITEDLEEVQEGFTIKREWGNKYIDEWNKIVTDEFKDVVKEINEELDGEMEWKTDGYEFSLHIKDEEESEEEEVEGSKVDMEAFTKLKEDGMMPWVK